jgi:LysM repeat protein
MHCKRCGARLQQGMVVCPDCGARQRRQAHIVRCWRCGRASSADLTICPRCGHQLRPLAPRWGKWFVGAAAVCLVGYLGVARLPWRGALSSAADFQGNMLAMIRLPDLPTAELVRAAAPNGTAISLLSGSRTPVIAATVTTRPPTATPRPSSSPTSLPTPSPAPGKPTTVVVQDGDTLIDLGIRTGVDWNEIARVNGISEFTILRPGDQLKLPGPTATSTPQPPTATPGPTNTPLPPTATPQPTGTPEPATATPTSAPVTDTPAPAPTATSAPLPNTYTVQAGDTLESIGAQLGIPWQDIAAFNQLGTSTSLSIGQQLRIPQPGEAMPPTPTPTKTPTPAPTVTSVPPTASPTPLPSFPAPVLSSPGDQSTFHEEGALIEIWWQMVEGLPGNAQYQVSLQWVKDGQSQEHHYFVPLSARPGSRVPLWLWRQADQPHYKYTWTVSAVIVTTDGKGGEKVIPLSPSAPARVFYWN